MRINNMEILKITTENFEKEVLDSDTPILVDFYADWCGPCKMMAQIIEEVAKEVSSVKIGKINIDENQDTAIKYNVMSIPTLILFKEGKPVKSIVGVKSKEEIIEITK